MGRIEQVAKEISQIAPRWIRAMQKGSTMPLALSTSQLTVLLAIHEKKQATTGELSKLMNVSAPTVTGLVDRLVRSQYVERFPSDKDRRVIYLQLTKKGQTEAQNLVLRIRRRWESILTALDIKEAENLVAIIKKILKVVEEKNV